MKGTSGKAQNVRTLETPCWSVEPSRAQPSPAQRAISNSSNSRRHRQGVREPGHSPPPPAPPSSSHKHGTTEGTSLPHPPASTHGPVSHEFVWSLSELAAVGSSHSCPGQLTTCHIKKFLVVLHPSPMSFRVLSVLVRQDWASSSTFSTSSAFRIL